MAAVRHLQVAWARHWRNSLQPHLTQDEPLQQVTPSLDTVSCERKPSAESAGAPSRTRPMKPPHVWGGVIELIRVRCSSCLGSFRQGLVRTPSTVIAFSSMLLNAVQGRFAKRVHRCTAMEQEAMSSYHVCLVSSVSSWAIRKHSLSVALDPASEHVQLQDGQDTQLEIKRCCLD